MLFAHSHEITTIHVRNREEIISKFIFNLRCNEIMLLYEQLTIIIDYFVCVVVAPH